MRIIFSILIFIFGFAFAAFPQEKVPPVVVDGDQISYVQESGELIAVGNVKLKHEDTEVFCNEARYNSVTNIAEIRGDVKITRGKSVMYGEDAVYDFNKDEATIVSIEINDPPVYGQAQKGEKKGSDKYIFKRGYVTTCDLDRPHYRLTAKKVTIYPGEKVVAKNMLLKIGKIPVFYFPVFSQSLKDKSFLAQFVPGKEKEWGGFLLTSWRYRVNDKNRGKLHLDWYDKRSQQLGIDSDNELSGFPFAVGITHKMETNSFGDALIKYYRLEDRMYELEDQRKDLFDMYPDRSTVPAKYLEDDRYKAQVYYEWQPRPDLSIKAEFNKFSDAFFIKDFFEREYEVEPQTHSYALINYSLSGSALSLFAQKRVNRFFTETEYLPQLEYNFYEQRLGASKFYLKSEDRIGNLGYVTGYTGVENNALRIYSHNTLRYVDRIKWLKINPYVGAYKVFYNQNKFGDDNVFRVAPEAGATLGTTLYKLINGNFNILGEDVDKMRHIFTPEISYSYIHDPTVSNENIVNVNFDSYDTISRAETLVLTLKNKLQAKNARRTWDFIYFSPSVQYNIGEETKGSYFDNITADLEVYPKEGVSVNCDLTYVIDKYDPNEDRVSQANVDLTFTGKGKVFKDGKESEVDKYSISLGHRYSRISSTQETFNFSYRINPKLKFSNYMRYEVNTGDLDKQQYVLSADLHCWWMDLGVDVDRHQSGGKDFTFWVMFKVKAFPDVEVNLDLDYKGAKTSY